MGRRILPGVLGLTLTITAGSCSTPVAPTPPPAALAISCPAAQSLQSLDGNTVIGTYPAPTTTGGAGQVTITCAPSTGSLFAVGSTPVTCIARDTRQQTATCSFPITVTRVPRLSATRFLAFADSITAGVLPTTCPLGGPPTGLALLADTARLWADLNASPGLSYPDVLSKQLSSRYAGQSFTVVNEGVPNEQATEGAVRFNGVLSTSLPQVVLLLEGVNDINVGGATSISGVVSSLRTMIRAARQGGATVLLGTILPERQGACRAYDYQDGIDDIIPANMQIRTLASAEGAVLVDLHPQFVPNTSTWLGLDGLHPNEAGYAAMAQAFLDTLRARLEH